MLTTATNRLEDSSSGGSAKRRPDSLPASSSSTDELTVSHHPFGSRAVEPQTLPLNPPTKIGDYLIRYEVGRGGMGVVYKAYHPQWDRIVALKCLKFGELASNHDIQRFQAEAEAISRLDHPNIVSVYEVGAQDRLRFFSMSFVEGETLADKLRLGPWEAHASATLIETLARAVAYAHQQGVIHRDLKPGNILIDNAGQPKITDFGLAKLMQHESEITISGDILGTPKYVPPEQAAGRVHEIGPASDIYSLGAILYCLLTGRPPFEAATFQATLKQVVESEPVTPSRLNSAVPKELETICLKCLEKSPSRRYSSASVLADDLQRFLDGVPITARPTTAVERAWRWCRKHPLDATLLALIVLVTVIGTSVSLEFAVRASNKAREAEDHLLQTQQTSLRLLAEQDRTRQVLYQTQIQQAYWEWRLGNIRRQTELLDACEPKYRDWEYRFLSNVSRRGHQTWTGHNSSVLCVATSPDGQVVAGGSRDRTIRIWDVVTGRELHKLEEHRGDVTCLAFSHDGRWLLSGSSDKTLRIWDRRTMTRRRIIRNFDDTLKSVAITPDGQRVVVATTNGSVKVLHFNSFETQHLLQAPGVLVYSVAISPDGKQVAAGFGNSTLRVWDIDTGTETDTLTNHEGAVNCVAFDPTGKWLARGSQDGVVKIWNVATRTELHTLQLHANGVTAVAFSSDGLRLASSGQDNVICESDVVSGLLSRTLRGHTRSVHGVAYLKDSPQIVSASDDITLKLWDTVTDQESRVSRGHTNWIDLVAVDPAQSLLASAGADNTIRLWELSTGRPLRTVAESLPRIEALTFNRDGQQILCVDGEGRLRTFDVATGDELTVVGDERRCAAAAICDSREWAATGGTDKTITLWNAASGQTMAEFSGHTAEIHCLSFSPNGNLLASGSLDQSIRLWDVEQRREKHVLLGHSKRPRSVAFDATGQRLVSASDDLSVRVWDVDTGVQLLELHGHTAYVRAATFSPDGRRIVSGSLDTHVKLWDAYTGDEVLALRGHRNAVLFAAFTRDGRYLISSGTDKTIRLWDAEVTAP